MYINDKNINEIKTIYITQLQGGRYIIHSKIIPVPISPNVSMSPEVPNIADFFEFCITNDFVGVLNDVFFQIKLPKFALFTFFNYLFNNVSLSKHLQIFEKLFNSVLRLQRFQNLNFFYKIFKVVWRRLKFSTFVKQIIKLFDT